MILAAVLFLIVVLVVIQPIVQQQREDALARRLEVTHDPREATILLDGARRQSRDEGGFLEAMRDRVWPTLFR